MPTEAAIRRMAKKRRARILRLKTGDLQFLYLVVQQAVDNHHGTPEGKKRLQWLEERIRKAGNFYTREESRKIGETLAVYEKSRNLRINRSIISGLSKPKAAAKA